MSLEPVRMNTDEFYHILRKRIFETFPDEAEVEAIAQAYAQAIRDAKQMDVTNASPEQFAGQIAESYTVPSGDPGSLRSVPGEPGLPADAGIDTPDADRRVAHVGLGRRSVPRRQP